jgi:hypothetical protein
MYAIKCTPNYYAGTYNAPQTRYVTQSDIAAAENDGLVLGSVDYNAIAEFESMDKAKETIATAVGEGPYYLAHGEAGRPSYDVVDLENIDEEDCVDASGCLGSGWDQVAPETLPEDVLDELDRANVEYCSSETDYDIYVEYAERNGRRYAIAFCPRSTAIQLRLRDGALSDICWDHQAYFIER